MRHFLTEIVLAPTARPRRGRSSSSPRTEVRQIGLGMRKRTRAPDARPAGPDPLGTRVSTVERGCMHRMGMPVSLL